jgi:carbon storage regulator CsrA
MLVLSRGRDEQIVFPNLGITVQILRITGNKVRVGVEAPAQVRVLRHEIAAEKGLLDAPLTLLQTAEQLPHDVRNRLNAAGLALHLSQKQLQAGLVTQAESTLQKALDEFSSLEKSAENSGDIRAEIHPRTALLVEDNANESALLAGYLQMSGYRVQAVGDGLEALDYLAAHQPPDVILLDMSMPRLDGPGTVCSIRGNPDFQGLKLFAVTGTDVGECDIDVGPTGVDHWFSKPVDPEKLVAEIDRRLQQASVPA